MKPLERTVVGLLDAFVRDVHEQKNQNTNNFFSFNAPSVCESQHFVSLHGTSKCFTALQRAINHLAAFR